MMWILILIAVITILYIAAISPRSEKREDMRPFLHIMFAHRGYHCMEKGIPENSMKAFRASIKKGYGIELDLHLSKDGQLVVFHDDTLARMCGRSHAVEDLTAEELTRLRLLDTAETIPLFSDVLSLVKGRVPLLIELKIPTSALAICEETFRQLKDYRGPYLIQSFNTMGLSWFKQNAPDVLRGQLSCNLTAKKGKEPWIFRFLIQHLLCNHLGRPDFISYKLSDLPTFNVWVLKYFFKTPVAVWTLRSASALKKGKEEYDMQIFEKPYENY